MEGLLKIKPLDGADGYLRWKESVLLRLNTVGVAHVLSKDPPSGDGVSRETAEKWARDDAMCRGHILATLSDRVLPDYVRHATGRAVWDAVARTYDLVWNPVEVETMFLRFIRFQFEKDVDLLEQLAHAEAMAATKQDPPLSDREMAGWICRKLPGDLGSRTRALWVDGRMVRINNADRYQTDESSDEEQEVKGRKGSQRRHRR
ncbi:hypothetical protein PR202_gb29581 [Eleusine coracana subsp. coracana]|uniref:Retrotransposon Copia-like N-terminal domain-containing protein n=1 Tax=Eleusine coracana subsp. coracana TaxID=191504 RepID=A0AAV5FXK1_ELECO|nr:hypothetical protein PR202_gb29581 [Eleusine coracana subsp. coracana]